MCMQTWLSYDLVRVNMSADAVNVYSKGSIAEAMVGSIRDGASMQFEWAPIGGFVLWLPK